MAAFADRVERAGYGLVDHPDRSRTPRSSGGASARPATSSARRCTSSPTAAAGRWPCGPRGPRPSCGPSSSTGPPLPWKAWYVDPGLPLRAAPGGPLPPAPPARRRGARGRRPRPRRRGDRAGRRLLPRRSGSATSRCGSTRWATATAARPTSSCCAAYLAGARRRARAPSTASGSRPTRCGSSTASARVPAPSPSDAPRLVDHLCDDRAARTSTRVQAGLDALGIAYELDHRLVRGFDYYTRTTFEFASDGARGGPERHRRRRPLRRAGRGARAARRRPGIGFGIGIERLLLACDAEGVLPVARPGLDAFVVDVTGGDVGPRPAPPSCAEPGCAADRAFDGRSMKSQLEARPTAPGARSALIVGPDEVAAGTVSCGPCGAATSGPCRGEVVDACREAGRRDRRQPTVAPELRRRPVTGPTRKDPRDRSRDASPSHVDAHPSVRAAAARPTSARR